MIGAICLGCGAQIVSLTEGAKHDGKSCLCGGRIVGGPLATLIRDYGKAQRHAGAAAVQRARVSIFDSERLENDMEAAYASVAVRR